MPVIPKGKVIQGEEARAKVTEEILTKSSLNKNELNFILTKLKDATYKGHEFETFYAVWVKVSTLLKKIEIDSKGL
jgi:hypothetical protein|tara:strand:- start:29 stop:256 length:228 start_codon:yes stop_codon:yes gene_type:complete